eukprot:jgi/Picre1/32409/NNA_007755.t1
MRVDPRTWAMLGALGVLACEFSTGVAWQDAIAQEYAQPAYANFDLPFDINQLAVDDYKRDKLAITTTITVRLKDEGYKSTGKTLGNISLVLYWWSVAAERGIEYVELYNEPDKMDRGCIDGLRWADDVRIRSQAIRAAYEDETDGQF